MTGPASTVSRVKEPQRHDGTTKGSHLANALSVSAVFSVAAKKSSSQQFTEHAEVTEKTSIDSSFVTLAPVVANWISSCRRGQNLFVPIPDSRSPITSPKKTT
jgi:BioD-like phosphotransacetylase family protein